MLNKYHIALKNYFIIALIFFLSLSCTPASAQPNSRELQRCSTTEYYKKLFAANPAYKRRFEESRTRLYRNKSVLKEPAILADNFSDTITLVIHVVGNADMQATVTNAVIQSQIDVLNEDYQGLNPDSVRIPPAFKPLFGKSRLVFQLARTNPFMEPTNGIIRVESKEEYNMSTFDAVKVSSQGGSDAWNPEKYLNIWVTSFGSSKILGLSVLPGDPQPLKFHGFVCDYRAFGRNYPHLFPKYNKGRSTTHELGHFFNLQHIWGDDNGACSGIDFPDDVANDDTPNQADATYDNPDPAGVGVIKTDNCSPAPPGIMYQNYMDYCDDIALVMFTKGQQTRMQNALMQSPDRSPLLSSVAYQLPSIRTHDAWIRKIISPVSPLCNTFFSPVVFLRNSGSLPLTSVKIIVVLNNGSPVVVNWTGSLAPYSEVKVSLPQMNAILGDNILSITTAQPNGATDENTANDNATMNFEVLAAIELTEPFMEGFSSTQFPPYRWKVINPDDDITWQHNANIGKNEPGSAWFNDWINASARRYDDLVTPNFSYNNVDSVFLLFNLAAATYSPPGTTTEHIDTLTVMVTRDCGNSFTTVYKKWGKQLQTINDSVTAPSAEFFPDNNQWRRDSVNLGTVLNASEANFQVYFRLSGNYENNIFIDDVTIYTKRVPQTLKEKGLLILPTVFSSNFAIWHYQPPTGLRYVNIFNAAGQLVWQRRFNGNAPTYIDVNLSGKSAGVYFVKLGYADGSRNLTQRIIKY